VTAGGRAAGWQVALVPLATLAAAAACGPAPVPSGPVPVPGTGGLVLLALRWTPSPPRARQVATVVVRLRVRPGARWAGRPVALSVAMPGMPMPQVPGERTVLRPLASGGYLGRVVFVMGGLWDARVDLAVGGRAVTVSVPVRVWEP
jgi:hypothetical protein